jgi:hypothetical protein
MDRKLSLELELHVAIFLYKTKNNIYKFSKKNLKKLNVHRMYLDSCKIRMQNTLYFGPHQNDKI